MVGELQVLYSRGVSSQQSETNGFVEELHDRNQKSVKYISDEEPSIKVLEMSRRMLVA